MSIFVILDPEEGEIARVYAETENVARELVAQEYPGVDVAQCYRLADEEAWVADWITRPIP